MRTLAVSLGILAASVAAPGLDGWTTDFAVVLPASTSAAPGIKLYAFQVVESEAAAR